jgi:hypothetical protein
MTFDPILQEDNNNKTTNKTKKTMEKVSRKIMT